MDRIEIVSATRLTENEFWGKSPLGLSLARLQDDQRFAPAIFTENRSGLPDLYNDRIQTDNDCDIVVFIHDDVWLDDYFFGDRIIQGLSQSDILGVAGNRRRLPYQPAWAFVNTEFQWDERKFLSGAMARGDHPFGSVRTYGATPAWCELMDGVFLAARKSVLRKHGVYFDSRFSFHFYDMDFCRTARQEGLRLLTWPICMTHQSTGNFESQAWSEGYQRYLQKWMS